MGITHLLFRRQKAESRKIVLFQFQAVFIPLKLTVCVVCDPPDSGHLGCVPYSNSSIANVSGARSGRGEGDGVTDK